MAETKPTPKIEPGPYTAERFLEAWADGRRVTLRSGHALEFLAHDPSAQGYAPTEPPYSLVVREIGRTGFGARHADGRMNKFREDQHDLVIIAKEPEPVVTWIALDEDEAVRCVGEEAASECMYGLGGHRALKWSVKLTIYPGQRRAEAEVLEERGHG